MEVDLSEDVNGDNSDERFKGFEIEEQEIKHFEVDDRTESVKEQQNYKTIFPYQNEEVTAVTVYNRSKDETWVVIGKADGTICASDLNTGVERIFLKGHQTSVIKLATAKNMLISACQTDNDDASVIVWELPSGSILHKYYCNNSEAIGMEFLVLKRIIFVESFSKECIDDAIVVGCKDGSVFVWNLPSNTTSKTQPQKDLIYALSESFSSDCSSMSLNIYGKDSVPYLALGSEESVCVWNLSSGEITCKIKGSFSFMCIVSYDVNIAPMIINERFTVFDIFTGKAVNTKSFEVNDTSGDDLQCTHMTFNNCADLPLVAAGMIDGSVVVYNFSTCAKICTADGHSGSVDAIALVPSSDNSNQVLITGGSDNKTNVWILSDSTPASCSLIKTFYPRRRGGHAGEVSKLVTSYIDDKPVLFSSSYDSIAIMWDLETCEEIRRFEGFHKQEINTMCVVLSHPDVPKSEETPLLVTGGCDKIIAVWDIRNGSLLFAFPRHHILDIHEVTSCSLPGHPLALLSAGADKNIILWDITSRSKLTLFESEHKESILCMQSHVQSDAGFLLTGSLDATAKYCSIRISKDNVYSMKTIYSWDHESQVNAVRLHTVERDCSLCITASKTKVFVYSASDGQLLRELEEPSFDLVKMAIIRHVTIFLSPTAISPNDLIIVTGRGRGILSVWDLATGFRIRSLIGGHLPTSQIVSADVFTSKESSWPIIVSGGSENRIVKWNMAASSIRHKLECESSEIYWVRKFQPDPTRPAKIIVASQNGMLRIYDSETFKLLSVTDIPNTLSIQSYSCSTVAVVTAKDRQSPIVITTDFQESSYIWNYQTKTVKTIRGEYVGAMDQNDSETGDPILFSHSDGDNYLTRWDVNTGKKLSTTSEYSDDLVGHMAMYNQARQGPVVAVGTSKGTIVVFNVNKGNVIHTLSGHTRAVYYTRANVESRRHILASVSEDYLLITWSIPNYDALHKIPIGNGYFVGIHRFPNDSIGLLYLSEGNNMLHVWDPFIGTKTREVSLGRRDVSTYRDEISDLTILSSGKDSSQWKIVTGTYDGQLQFLNYETLQVYASFESGHSDQISWMEFCGLSRNSSESHQLFMVSASDDGSVILWNSQTKQLHSKIRCPMGIKGVCNVSVIKRIDGNYLVMGFNDKSAAIWDIEKNELVAGLIGGHSGDITAVTSMNQTGNDSDVLVLTASKDKTVRYWNLQGKLQSTILKGVHKDSVTAMAQYSTSLKAGDGSKAVTIVTGSADKSIVLWNALNGKVIMKLQGGHKKGIMDLDVFTMDDDTQHIVSVGKDGIAVIWNASSGSQIRQLQGGHEGTIKSVAIYQDKKHPLIATGGKDGYITVWSADRGEILQKFKVQGKGYKHHVTALAFESDVSGAMDSKRNLKLYIGNSVGVIEVREIYLENFLPLPRDVMKAFEHDLTSGSNDWIAVSGLSKRHEHGLWAENIEMFAIAVRENRVDFLKLFQSRLTDFIYRAIYKNDDSKTNDTLLRQAVEAKNGACVKVLLSCWSEALQKEARDVGDQLWWHPALTIDAKLFKSDLLLLSKNFPTLFSDFICSIKLIRRDMSEFQVAALPRDSRSLLKCGENLASDVFGDNIDVASVKTVLKSGVRNTLLESFVSFIESHTLLESVSYIPLNGQLIYDAVNAFFRFVNRLDSVQPVTTMTLPIRNLASIEMLQALVDVSVTRKSVEIFDNDAGIYALRCAWEAFGFRIHLLSMFEYILFVIVFTASVLSFSYLIDSSVSVIAWILQSLVLAFLFLFAIQETSQLGSQLVSNWHERKLIDRRRPNVSVTLTLLISTFFDHFLDVWNMVDLGVIWFCSSGTILRLVYWEETVNSRSLLSVGSVFAYFKFLYFLRPFEQSGPLVTMILKIAGDIRYFLLVLLIVLLGFAQAFYVISYGDDSLNFGTIQNALLNSFLYMLGGFDSDFSSTKAPELGVALLVMFLLFMTILLLNLLIALMGESFGSVSSNKIANWRLEQASIILEQSFLRSRTSIMIPPLIHVLKYSSDLEGTAPTQSFEELETSVGSKLDDLKDSLKSEFKNEIAVIQADTNAMKESLRQQIEKQNEILAKILSRLDEN